MEYNFKRLLIFCLTFVFVFTISAKEKHQTRKQKKMKVYVSQIWDDAILNDLRFISILKKYNAKATFAIDAGNIKSERQVDAWKNKKGVAFGKVSINDIKTVFADFEIANHGFTHKHLPSLSPEQRMLEIKNSKDSLESWLGRPVLGFVYPGCPYDSICEESLRQAGHLWARTCENTPDFESNTNFMEFRTTVAFNSSKFWSEFERIKTTGGVFTFWGHTFFTSESEWADIESKIARLSQDPSVVWVNTSDLFMKFKKYSKKNK